MRIALEFLVIFGGVYLGLVADDWRQSRDESERELLVLQDVLEDLEMDSVELEGTLSKSIAWDQAGLWVSRHAGIDVPADSVQLVTRTLSLVRFYRPQHSAYSGLRDSGDLSLITDSELRRALVDYFEVRQRYIIALYSDGMGPFFDAARRARQRHFRFVADPEAGSLGEGGRFTLRTTWVDASADIELISAWVELGLFGSTVAQRVPVALAENAELRSAIREYLN